MSRWQLGYVMLHQSWQISEDQERRIYVSRVHCVACLASCVASRPSLEPSKRINWMISYTQESTSCRQGSTLRK